MGLNVGCRTQTSTVNKEHSLTLSRVKELAKIYSCRVLSSILQPLRLFLLFLYSLSKNSAAFEHKVKQIFEAHRGDSSSMRKQLMLILHEEIKNDNNDHQLNLILSLIKCDVFEEHIENFLQGATIKIKNGNEFIEWLDTKEIQREYRYSSHDFVHDDCWKVDNSRVSFCEFLMWRNREKECFVQLEAHTFDRSSPMASILHCFDYLEYKGRSRNVGPLGHSEHVEMSNPLNIKGLTYKI